MDHIDLGPAPLNEPRALLYRRDSGKASLRSRGTFKALCQFAQDAFRSVQLGVRDLSERRTDRRLNGSPRRNIETSTLGCESEQRSASVLPVGPPTNHSGVLQPAKDTRERTGIDMEDRSQLAG